jgi:hypothetical protein
MISKCTLVVFRHPKVQKANGSFDLEDQPLTETKFNHHTQQTLNEVKERPKKHQNRKPKKLHFKRWSVRSCLSFFDNLPRTIMGSSTFS